MFRYLCVNVLVPFLNELASDSGTSVAAANPPISPVLIGSTIQSENIQKATDIWKLQTQR